jgi:hypothetical protein
MSIIKIKRSSGIIAPTALALGEFGYAYGVGTQSDGGDRLYLGTGGETDGLANAIDVVGGKYFVNLLDHVHGTLTTNSAIIVDTDSKIDILNVDNITINGNTISSTDTNGNIILDPDGAGVIKLNGPVEFSTSTTFTGLLNADGGIAVDGSKFRVDGDTGAVYTASTLEVDGESTLASAIVEDLTDNRVVIAGTGGALEDDANFTFDGSTLDLVADYTQTGTGRVTGQWNVDNLRLDDNTLSSTNTDGNIVLTPDGDGYVTISGTNGIVIPAGTNDEQGPAVTGAIRYNTTNTQFEGYSGDNWSSLGGVRSVDGFTYIIAESSPAASDDILHFYAGNAAGDAGDEVAQLDITSLRLLQTTTATSTSSGALVVAGGAGIAENLFVGGNAVIGLDLAVNGGDITTDQTTFNLLNTTATILNIGGAATAIDIGDATQTVDDVFDGTTSINHNVTVDGDVSVGGGNFTVAHLTGNAETAGNMIIGGDLTVNGTTTSVNVDVLDVEDALIRLASGNTADSVDIGFIGRYNDGDDKFAGVFRDATTNEFYIFSELVDADLTDNVIDRADASFALADVNVDTIKFAQQSFTLTGDVSGTINISDFGTTAHSISVTINADSVALGTDTTGDYVATIDQATGGATDANGTTNNGIVIAGSGTETAAVTIKANLADTAGGIGTSTYDATNFDVSAGGVVTIDTIDGGTF